LTCTDIIIHYLLDIKAIRIVEQIENQVITYKTGENKDWDSFSKEEQNKMLNDATEGVTDGGMDDIIEELEQIYEK